MEEKCKNMNQNQNQIEKQEKIIIKDNKSPEQLEKLKLELEKLRKELEDLKNEHGQTIIKVKNNKEQIDIIFGRLNDVIKGYNDGDKKLQK